MYARDYNKFDWDRWAGKTARQVVGAFRIPQEFPESLPQWVITRIRPRLSPLVAPSLTWPPARPRAGGSPSTHLRLVRVKGMNSTLPASISLLNRSVATRVHHPSHTPIGPLFSAGSPADARRLPRKRSRLVYSESWNGTRYSEEGYRVRIVYVCVGTCVTSTRTRICRAQRMLVACASREPGLTDIVGF